MRTFAIGDIQGCYDSLRRLLDKIAFDPSSDRLWSVGDLVNRGPRSLDVLRFCRSLGDAFATVLGNHDLHLLAIAHGAAKPRKSDTLDEILQSPERDEILQWLQAQPLFRFDPELGVALVHAGVPPQWSLQQTQQYAGEVASVLQSPSADEFFRHMYGNQPDCWDDKLQGPERWRVITNYLTRMRFCSPQGRLELTQKLGPESAPPGFLPWYQVEGRKMAETPILFGHWASLEGAVSTPRIQALDTGCVWGGRLTVAQVDAGFRRFSIEAEDGP